MIWLSDSKCCHLAVHYVLTKILPGLNLHFRFMKNCIHTSPLGSLAEKLNNISTQLCSWNVQQGMATLVLCPYTVYSEAVNILFTLPSCAVLGCNVCARGQLDGLHLTRFQLCKDNFSSPWQYILWQNLLSWNRVK